MKNLLSYLGVIIVIIGVIVLGVSVLTDSVRNTMLLISALLVILGLFLHIFLNREVI